MSPQAGKEASKSARRVIGRVSIGRTEYPVLNRLSSGPGCEPHTYILLTNMGVEYRLEHSGADWTLSGKRLPPQKIPAHMVVAS